MNETIDIKDFKKENKKRQFKERIINKLDNCTKWCSQNKEFLIVAIPVVGAVITGTAKTVKGLSRNVALKQEKLLKEKFIYDRSLGAYIELRKPLNKNQLKTVLQRKNNGENVSKILLDMNLIK